MCCLIICMDTSMHAFIENKQTNTGTFSCVWRKYLFYSQKYSAQMFNYFLLSNVLECGLPSIFFSSCVSPLPPSSSCEQTPGSGPTVSIRGWHWTWRTGSFFYCSGQFNYDNDALSFYLTNIVFLVFLKCFSSGHLNNNPNKYMVNYKDEFSGSLKKKKSLISESVTQFWMMRIRF